MSYRPTISVSAGRLRLVFTVLAMCSAVTLWGQGPPMRRHRSVGVRPLQLVPANREPPVASRQAIDVDNGRRHVLANGIPDHRVGQFPNRGNPHQILTQQYGFVLAANPRLSGRITPTRSQDRRGPPGMPFGVAVNGVLFDPGTAEFWNGDRNSGWNYEALGGAVPFGLDENYAHVQPNGAYHYHGMPTQLLERLGLNSQKHSPLVGWAADGFPIYALYGYEDPQDPASPIVELKTGYRLREGRRPGGAGSPGGQFDGTFVEDMQFREDAGDLDACNGRTCVTPEFPEGTYAYFLTKRFPVIPRAFHGTPVNLRHAPQRR